jgi:general secretion pathway protein C
MKLQLDARARRWVRRLPRVNVYSAAELALLAVLAVQLARLSWAIVTPVSPLGDWRGPQVAVPAAPAESLASFDPFFRTTAGQAAPAAAVTALSVTLFGVRMNDATGGGSAIVAGPDGVQRSVSVGEEVAPGVKLAGVSFDHVTLDRGGTAEDLFLDQSGGTGAAPPSPAPGAPLMAPPAPAGVAPAALRTDIGYIPRIEGGRLSGLTVRSQGSGAAFRAAGLQDGDVVTAIAGRPVTGAGDLDRIARDYAGGGNLSLTVDRGGRTTPLNLTLAGAAR